MSGWCSWLTFVMAGFWGSVAGLLYVYYNLFLSPHAISLQQSAEILLMAILGGASIARPARSSAPPSSRS